MGARARLTRTPMQLGDTRVLVTGASRGLGLEIARQLAAAGADLALSGRDVAALASAVATVRAARAREDQQVLAFRTELANAREVERLAEDCLRDLGRVDALVNNAAVQGPIGPFESAAPDAWRAVFDVNLFAPARLIQLLLPGMRARGRGKIVNLSGGGAASPRPHVSAYAASKCALVRLTETLAVELARANVEVNAVAPGALSTRMTEELLAAGREALPFEHDALKTQLEHGGASLSRAAALVVWLVSPASDGISGRLLSAQWDDWEHLAERRDELRASDLYTLRRIRPLDRRG